MDKDNQAEGEIIDVEAEVETPPGQQNDVAPSGKKPFSLPLLLAVIAIAAVTASWIAGYRYWHNIVNDLTTIQGRISTVQQQNADLNAAIETARQTLQQQQQAIQEQDSKAESRAKQMAEDTQLIKQQAESMQQAVAQVSEKIGSSDNQWMLAEAEYLMRIANYKLALARDVSTALAALKQADERLRDSGDPGLIAIREKLADEITALQAIRQPDVAGIAATLQSLSAQVTTLKLAGSALTPAQNNLSKTADTERERNLDTLLQDSWRGFRQLMVIRQHNQPVSAMLPPSQHYFLYQNMQLQLESARLALLRRESIIYQNSLTTARDWLEKFFDGEQQSSQSMLTSINNLAQTELTPTLPDISNSLKLLAQYRGAGI